MNTKSQPISLRPDPTLKRAIDEWLVKNPGISQSGLAIRAIKEFISQPQQLQPVKIEALSEEQVSSHFDAVAENHKDAIERLK